MTIKDFIFKKKPLSSEQIILQKALDHYCSKCDMGFRTKGARNAHASIKHKYEQA